VLWHHTLVVGDCECCAALTHAEQSRGSSLLTLVTDLEPEEIWHLDEGLPQCEIMHPEGLRGAVGHCEILKNCEVLSHCEI
jgi:hypothetical protein